MRHARYSGLYCLKCGAAQTMSAKSSACAGTVNKKLCGGTAFTSSLALVPWDALCDDDVIFLKSIRTSTEDVK